MHSYLIRDNSSEHKGTDRQPRQRQHKQAETNANKADTLELEVCWLISLVAKDEKQYDSIFYLNFNRCTLSSKSCLIISLQNLLSMESAKEKENKKLNDEILQLLSQPTAKARIKTIT